MTEPSATPSDRTARSDPGQWLAMLIGVAVFFAITRGSVLDPRNADWLMRGDPATSFLGWQFFRQSPLVQLPFGANQNYGMEIGSSVIFTDSIPLLAFLFKPFTSLLPATFQYFGIWILLSFVLQSALAYKLLRRFLEDRWLALIGSAFFALAPVCIARLEEHFSLFGQWVVLAALYLCFAPRFSFLAWLVLLSIAALIHFHFLAMVSLIWVGADLWQRRWRNELSTAQAATYVLTGALVILTIMWLAGYFMLDNRGGQAGFGRYRMNLLSMIDPDGLWSLLLPDQPGGAVGYEGFNYLGIGVLVLALFAGYQLLKDRRASLADHRSIVPLLFVSLVFSLLALSNRVALGNVEFVVYQVPEVLKPFADDFRSSARMFWPVYYLIYLAVFVLISRRFIPPVAIVVCSALLAVQVADSWRALRHLSDRLAYPPAWSSPLKSALWTEIGRRYKRISYVLPRNAPDAFLPWAVFAANYRMTMNFGYFARVDVAKLDAARNDIATAIIGNRLETETLYVFENDALWTLASTRSRLSDVTGVVDGFRIIAPKLKECTVCDMRALADVQAEKSSGYSMRESIAFAKGGTGQKHALMGWSSPEEWGTWSDSPISALIVKLAQMPDRDVFLAIEGRAFVNEKHRTQLVDVSVNRVRLETLRYESPDVELKTLRIPKSVLWAGDGLVLIEFSFRNAKSPHELGLHDDRRRLGLKLISVKLSADQ